MFVIGRLSSCQIHKLTHKFVLNFTKNLLPLGTSVEQISNFPGRQRIRLLFLNSSQVSPIVAHWSNRSLHQPTADILALTGASGVLTGQNAVPTPHNGRCDKLSPAGA